MRDANLSRLLRSRRRGSTAGYSYGGHYPLLHTPVELCEQGSEIADQFAGFLDRLRAPISQDIRSGLSLVEVLMAAFSAEQALLSENRKATTGRCLLFRPRTKMQAEVKTPCIMQGVRLLVLCWLAW